MKPAVITQSLLLIKAQGAISKLQDGDKRVASLVGISQGYLQKLNLGGVSRSVSESEAENMRVCKRFFTALMLNDIIQEVC